MGPCDCGSTVGKNPNPVVHQILKDLPIFCPHYKRGCRDFFAQAEDLNYHQQGCGFRHVSCPDLGCKCEEKILFKDVIGHLNQQHRFSCSISYSNKFTEMLPTNYLTDLSVWRFKEKPIKIKNGTIFFLAGLVNDNFANFWIYGLLSPLETKNYAYTLSITGNIMLENTRFLQLTQNGANDLCILMENCSESGVQIPILEGQMFHTKLNIGTTIVK